MKIYEKQKNTFLFLLTNQIVLSQVTNPEDFRGGSGFGSIIFIFICFIIFIFYVIIKSGIEDKERNRVKKEHKKEKLEKERLRIQNEELKKSRIFLKKIEERKEEEKYWKKIKENGYYIGYFKSGSIHYKIFLKDMIPNGNYKEYYENGNLKYDYLYKDGKIDGEYKEYYDNGNLKFYVKYKDGVEDGEFKDYSLNGTTYNKGFYIKGVIEVDPEKYYSNGKKIETQSILHFRSPSPFLQYRTFNRKIPIMEKYHEYRMRKTFQLDTERIELDRIVKKLNDEILEKSMRFKEDSSKW